MMHPRISVNSVCFWGHSLQQQERYWQQLGARRISLIAPQLEEDGVDELQRVLSDNHCQVETIVHGFVPAALSADPVDWTLPRQQLSRRIAEARQLNARSIYMTTGGHGDMVWEQAAESFARAIAPCVDEARSEGIALMIENAPAQYADMHLPHSLRDTLTLAEMADVGVCIDLFFCWGEAGLQASLQRAVPRCQLVQVSDYVYGDRNLPARAVPGDGNIPLARLLGWLLQAGYEGAFDLELLGPRIAEEGPLQATGRTIRVLGDTLQSLGA